MVVLGVVCGGFGGGVWWFWGWCMVVCRVPFWWCDVIFLWLC